MELRVEIFYKPFSILASGTNCINVAYYFKGELAKKNNFRF
jgi:hypothetical protein